MVTRKRAEPEYYLRWTLKDWSTTCDAFSAEAMMEYARCFDAATIHASCEDYRAGASLDLEHDEESKGQKLACPLMVLWSTSGLGNQYPVEAIWREYARDVRGRAMSCGHFLAEERSEETAAALIDFFG